MKKLGLILIFLSLGVQADEKEWLKITAAANTASGVATYIAEAESSVIQKVASGLEPPVFIQLSNMTIVDQNGGIKKSSEFPWGGKLINGDTMYIRIDNIIEMQTLSEDFSQELTNYNL
tara:strand:- start:2148 stop:2504 length:357 start_codon:yes stop_codon:yes gene_type:complete